MARDSTGKWVQRAGATGGGRSYRTQMPTNWYAAIVVIVVLGLASVVFARYEYRNGSSSSSSTVQPTVGTTWYAGYQADICGSPAAPLASNASTATKTGFFTTGSGVITIKPLSSGQAGTNAVFGKFVDGYPPMELTSSTLRIPGGPVYTNGETCPKGTPDAGQKGVVQVLSWSNALLTKAKPVKVTGDPGQLRFSQNQLVSLGFLPASKAPARPSGSVVIALLDAANATSTSTTTPTGSTTVSTPTGSTVVPAVPSTTVPASSTPASTTPTTAATKPVTTTPTTKPASSGTTATTK